MPLEKLTARELSGTPGGRPKQEYVDFLSSLRVGEGGRATVAAERITKQAIKNRLMIAAKAAGVELKFHRSSKDEVLFSVASRT